jgi:hypothetical protein
VPDWDGADCASSDLGQAAARTAWARISGSLSGLLTLVPTVARQLAHDGHARTAFERFGARSPAVARRFGQDVPKASPSVPMRGGDLYPARVEPHRGEDADCTHHATDPVLRNSTTLRIEPGRPKSNCCRMSFLEGSSAARAQRATTSLIVGSRYRSTASSQSITHDVISPGESRPLATNATTSGSSAAECVFADLPEDSRGLNADQARE